MSTKFEYGKEIVRLSVDAYMARPVAKMLQSHFGYNFTIVETMKETTVYGPVEMQEPMAVAKWQSFAIGVLKAWIEPITKFM